MNKIKQGIQILSILAILGFTVYSCEQNDEAVGYGLLNSGEASGLRRFIDLISYNLFNGDSIRSDESRLQLAVFGVYDEGVFGKVKASYVTQVRLGNTNYVFSDSIENGQPKATVDSAVLYFTPAYSTESDEVEVDTIYTDEMGNPYDQDSEDDVDTFRIITKYPITQKYGNASETLNVEVNTINEFLYSVDSTFYSNKSITNETHLGQGVIKDFVIGVEYKDSNSSALDSINGVNVDNITPSVRIPLDVNYFQNNIVNMQGSNVLSDQSRFIQYLKGIKMSTPDDNAFLLTINPANLSLRMYYSYVKKKDSEGEIAEGSSNYTFNLISNYNVRIGLYERNASLSSYLSPFVGNSNVTTGDDALYLDGLGGFKTVIKLDQSQLDQLKSDFVNNHIAIVGAKLKFYKHPLAADFESPDHIFAYVYNNAGLPMNISEVVESDFSVFPDIATFNNEYGYSFNPAYNSDYDYYAINITDYIKNIIEKDSVNYPIMVEMGNFIYSDLGLVSDVQNNNKAYNPFRMVFKGNTYGDEENLKLEILYTEN